MSKLSKIAVTVIAVLLFVVLFALLQGARESAGAATPGVIGIILLAGLIGALKAVWKKSR